MGLGQGDEFGLGQGGALGAVAKLGEIIDGELAGHGVGEQQAIIVGQRQSAGCLCSGHIQLQLARCVIGLQATGLEQRDPEPLPLGIEDDPVGSMAGGNHFLKVEIFVQQQQAIAAVIGDQQGAVIGAGNLAQIAPQLHLLESLAAIALKESDRACAQVGGDEARALPLLIDEHPSAHLLGKRKGADQQQEEGQQG